MSELRHANNVSWKNHKYINKYIGKNGKWVYVYPDNSGKSPMDRYTTKRYMDKTIVKNNSIESRTNQTSTTNSKGYGVYKHDYTRTSNNKTVSGHVETKIVKGKSLFTKKRIIKMGNDSYTTIERGKLRQAAEKGSSWLANRLKRRK